MEELSQKIAELIETLNKNSVPIGLTIFCMIVPIVISLAVAIFAVVQHYQNKRLQKNISEKELKVQMHGDILNIIFRQFIGKARASKDFFTPIIS